jgi:hypothetical protein
VLQFDFICYFKLLLKWHDYINCALEYNIFMLNFDSLWNANKIPALHVVKHHGSFGFQHQMAW